jgi:hypothetical protein
MKPSVTDEQWTIITHPNVGPENRRDFINALLLMAYHHGRVDRAKESLDEHCERMEKKA